MRNVQDTGAIVQSVCKPNAFWLCGCAFTSSHASVYMVSLRPPHFSLSAPSHQSFLDASGYLTSAQVLRQDRTPQPHACSFAGLCL